MLSDLAIRVRALLRRTTVERELEHELIEARGRDPGFDERPYQVERLRGDD